jgi:hypothetical protein
MCTYSLLIHLLKSQSQSNSHIQSCYRELRQRMKYNITSFSEYLNEILSELFGFVCECRESRILNKCGCTRLFKVNINHQQTLKIECESMREWENCEMRMGAYFVVCVDFCDSWDDICGTNCCAQSPSRLWRIISQQPINYKYLIWWVRMSI